MFSTSQQEYIKSVIPTYAKQGYKYYVVSTVTNTGSSYYSDPDLIFYFSKHKISSNTGYLFSFSGDVLVVSCRSFNYSSYSSANNGPRVSVSESNARTVRINTFEHVYTNAQFEGLVIQPDYNLISGGETNVRLEALCFIVLVVSITCMLFRILRVGR